MICKQHQKLSDDIAGIKVDIEWIKKGMEEQSDILKKIEQKRPGMGRWMTGAIAGITGSLTALVAHFIGGGK